MKFIQFSPYCLTQKDGKGVTLIWCWLCWVVPDPWSWQYIVLWEVTAFKLQISLNHTRPLIGVPHSRSVSDDVPASVPPIIGSQITAQWSWSPWASHMVSSLSRFLQHSTNWSLAPGFSYCKAIQWNETPSMYFPIISKMFHLGLVYLNQLSNHLSGNNNCISINQQSHGKVLSEMEWLPG